MNRTLFVGLLGVVGLLVCAERSMAAHPICGTWKHREPGVGESDLRITESVAGDGTFDVQQVGLGNAVGWGTFKDGVLTIHWVTGDLRGFFRFEVDREH